MIGLGCAVALVLGGGGVSALAEAELPRLRPERVHVAAEEARGPQFLAADAKGRLVLLRGLQPAFYEVDSSGEVRPWGDPDSRQSALESAVSRVLDAALSPEGSWILRTPERILTISRHETEVLAKSRWSAVAVALPDRPVAAVIPVVEGRVVPRYDADAPPLLLEHTSSGWRPLALEPWSEVETRVDGGEHTHRMYRELCLARASSGGLWAAHRYLYRLRKYSESGRELLDLTLAPEATPEHLDEDAVEELRQELEAEAELYGMEGAEIEPFTAKATIQAVAEGRDGKVYLYVAPGIFGPEPLLDRYDPLNHRLERAVLEMEHSGRVTLASANDGLWIGATAGRHKIWRIGWPKLDELGWERVSGLHSDGVPMEP